MAHRRRTRRESPAQRAARIFRHFVFLMIGALLAVPYIVVFIWATQVAAINPASGVVALGVLLLMLAVPALLSVTRSLERTAVRELLGVPLAEPAGGLDAGRQWRGAAWYVVHLISGGLTLVTVAFAVPVIITVAVLAITGELQTVTEVTAAVVPSTDTTTAVLWSLGLGLGVTIFNVLVGIALPHWARIMLGPTSAERAALEGQQAELAARRNQLARDLHDSVGHALTVTTLQATAAQGMIARDPEAAERAMQAVADTGRAALAELDHVIGILRGSSDGHNDDESLPALPAFLDRLAAQGLRVVRHYDDTLLPKVPDAVSRPAYRVLQEGLTNALKYARPQHADLYLLLDGSSLKVQLTNPVDTSVEGKDTAHLPAKGPTADQFSGGRGLEGIRERVRLARGTVEMGRSGDVWLLQAELPVSYRSEDQ